MDYQKMIEDILKTDAFKSLLTEALVQRVVDEYHFQDAEGELIKREIREIIKSEAKSMVKDVVENYYELRGTKTLLEKEINNLTQSQVIDLLITKLRNPNVPF